MNKQQIKPARPGLRVRKADGGLLNADGETLAVTAYWRRRESEGDVVISTPSKPKSGKADKEA